MSNQVLSLSLYYFSSLLSSLFPTLPALDCGPVPVLENGYVTNMNGTLVGSKVTYTCGCNYEFTVGSSMERTCQSSGNWSDEPIECSEDGNFLCSS